MRVMVGMSERWQQWLGWRRGAGPPPANRPPAGLRAVFLPLGVGWGVRRVRWAIESAAATSKARATGADKPTEVHNALNPGLMTLHVPGIRIQQDCRSCSCGARTGVGIWWRLPRSARAHRAVRSGTAAAAHARRAVLHAAGHRSKTTAAAEDGRRSAALRGSSPQPTTARVAGHARSWEPESRLDDGRCA